MAKIDAQCKADLHIHTTFSDSTLSPEDVVYNAKNKGIFCIAITDHDTVDAIKPAQDIAEKEGIELIPGVELTADLNGIEAHILGYFIDPTIPWFQEMLLKLRIARKRRFLKMLEKLQEFGIKLEVDSLLSEDKNRSLGRLHLARELKKKGYVKSIPEAFERYLGEDKPCYVKKEALSIKQAITMIKQIGGISVLAHPFLLGNDDLIINFIKEGLDGIEVYHPEQNSILSRHYLEFAYKHNLVITGGSDCHGEGKAKVLIGTVKITYDLVLQLKKYRNVTAT